MAQHRPSCRSWVAKLPIRGCARHWRFIVGNEACANCRDAGRNLPDSAGRGQARLDWPELDRSGAISTDPGSCGVSGQARRLNDDPFGPNYQPTSCMPWDSSRSWRPTASGIRPHCAVGPRERCAGMPADPLAGRGDIGMVGARRKVSSHEPTVRLHDGPSSTCDPQLHGPSVTRGFRCVGPLGTSRG